MIILKHLVIERFRLLREINLHFPQRGSILIQGPNEAGKSTLFESIYFALYGELLAPKRKKHSRSDEGYYDDLFSMEKSRPLLPSHSRLGLRNLLSRAELNVVKARPLPSTFVNLVCQKKS